MYMSFYLSSIYNSPINPLPSYKHFLQSVSLHSSMEEKYSMDDQDETEETLSFCDLPMYSCDFSKEDQSLSSSSTSSSTDQEFFEFFSEDWSNSSNYPLHQKNIVFCGKIIHFKEPPLSSINPTHNLSNKNPQKRRSRFLFSWFSKLRSSSKNQPKYSRSSRSKSLPPPAEEKWEHKAAKGGRKGGFLVRKVSILASPAKSRWRVLIGMGVGVPAEMELSDIRSRQSRLRSPPAALFRSGCCDEKVSGGMGLWGLIRTLGCGGSHRWNAVVETQFGGVPSA